MLAGTVVVQFGGSVPDIDDLTLVTSLDFPYRGWSIAF